MKGTDTMPHVGGLLGDAMRISAAGRRLRGWIRPALPGMVAAAAAGVLAACGTAGGGTSTPGSPQPGPGTTGAISTRHLPGVGTILVDSTGKTIYAPDQEHNGKIVCTGSCLSFWFPVTTPSASPAVPSGLAGAIGITHRPDDGKAQLTYQGEPLYTFRLDQSAGQVHGNNFTDKFGSRSFTWHAVTTGTAATPSAGGSVGSTPSGYPAPSQGGVPGY